MFANLKDHKNRDVVFIEDNISIENDLKMCQSGRNESSMVVVMINNRNHLCVVMVKSAMSKWEITWLEMKMKSNDPWERRPR